MRGRGGGVESTFRSSVVPPGDKTSSRLEDRTFVFDDEQFVREDP